MERAAAFILCCFILGFIFTKAFDISNGECLEDCTGRPTDTIARWRDCSDCRSYRKCTSEGMLTITCPSDLVWNWRLDTPNCDLPSTGCDDCITSCDGKELDTGRRWRHCSNCHFYLKCTSEDGLVTTQCPSNLTWNWRLNPPNCDMSEDLCQSPTTVCSDGCDFNVNGSLLMIPHCQCCNKFFTCFITGESSHTCSVGLAYSDITRNCANETEIDCGNRVRCDDPTD